MLSFRSVDRICFIYNAIVQERGGKNIFIMLLCNRVVIEDFLYIILSFRKVVGGYKTSPSKSIISSRFAFILKQST